MPPTDRLLLPLADLAEGQWGLITSAQAATAAGAKPHHLKRLADRGLLLRIRHGVYRLTGAPEPPWEALRAEWLALEPARAAADRLTDSVPMGVVSHRSAAVVQNLGDLDADRHQFTVPRRRESSNPDLRFRIGELDRQDWHLVDGLPVTRPLRTVTDLAAARTDGGHLATVVRDAALTGDTTTAELAAALRPYAHHYGIRAGDGEALVRAFIQDAGVPAAARMLTTLAEHLPRPSNVLPAPTELTITAVSTLLAEAFSESATTAATEAIAANLRLQLPEIGAAVLRALADSGVLSEASAHLQRDIATQVLPHIDLAAINQFSTQAATATDAANDAITRAATDRHAEEESSS